MSNITNLKHFLKYYLKRTVNDSVRSWLFQTGYRLFIDSWRRKKKQLWLPLASFPEAASDLSICPEKQVYSF
ncbi:MAG TPA: hypothetical protein VGE40_02520 [Bacilli bacterium]